MGEREDLTRQEARSAIKELAQTLHPRRTFICQRMCLPDLNGAAARKRWGGTSRWNRDRLMRSAFGGVVGAASLAASVVETAVCVASVVETRWAAAETPQGCQGYHWSFWLVLSRVSPPSAPCAAVGRRVCGLACGVVLCFPHERGRAGALLRAPVLAEGGAQCVWASRSLSRLLRGERCLLSNRMLRVSSSARIATSFGPSRRRRAVPVETCR